MTQDSSRASRPFRGAVFDMGNTLMEFETIPFAELNRLGAASAHAALKSRGRTVSAEDFIDAFLAEFRTSIQTSKREEHREIALVEIFPPVLSRLGIGGEPGLVDELIAAHYAPIVEQVFLYPGVAETLQELRARGVRVGLVSNTIWPEEFHVRDLERFGILSLFDSLVFSSTLGVAKPNPRIFQVALEELGVSASEAFYVGDRLDVDVVGAQQSGMAAVLKTHPIRSREAHREVATPDWVIDDLSELLVRLPV